MLGLGLVVFGTTLVLKVNFTIALHCNSREAIQNRQTRAEISQHPNTRS
jgi:hypothetical protein